jgi:hypothetical protein
MAEPKKEIKISITHSESPAEPTAPVADKPVPATEAAKGPPALITKRALMKEPTAQAASQSDEVIQSAEPMIMKTAGKPTIEPTGAVTKATIEASDQAITQVPAETPAAPAPAETEHKPAPTPAPAEDKEEEAKPDSDDEKPEQTAEAIEEAEAAKQAEHDTAIQKLVDEKQYFLPINAVEKRRSQRFILLGILLSVVLAFAWLDVALDAGIISLNVNLPHTHLFDKSVNSSVAATTPAPSAPAPNPNTLYKATASQLSFQYPNDWTLTDDSKGGNNEQYVIVPPSEAKSTTPFFSISFSNAAGQTTGSFTVLDVQFTKLPNEIASQPVYLREMVFKSSGGISIESGLTNDNSAKVGDTLQVQDPQFTAPPGYSTLFTIYAFTNEQGQPFSSLSTAQTFMKSADYQKAKKILLSTAPLTS